MRVVRVTAFRAGLLSSTVFGLSVLILSLGLPACSGPKSFEGTVLSSNSPAAPIELHNQFGEPFSLADHQGQVVVLTFLYTNCPDVCPLTTSKLREAYEMLGDNVEDVEIAVVSVDPERDTVEAALEFSERWDMAQAWDFLVGDRERLSQVWSAYYVAATVRKDANSTAEGHLLDHSAPVYLIDRDGLMRVVFTFPFTAESLAHDVRLLLE